MFSQNVSSFQVNSPKNKENRFSEFPKFSPKHHKHSANQDITFLDEEETLTNRCKLRKCCEEKDKVIKMQLIKQRRAVEKIKKLK